MGTDRLLIGTLLAAALCAGCIVPPEIEVAGNYPPTIDLTVVNDPPPYERAKYDLGCPRWVFRLPRIAINDRNKDDQHYVRFFRSDRQAANGWVYFEPSEAAGLITAQIDPDFLPTYERGDGNRLVLRALITDRPWPSTDSPLELAPGAGSTSLFWVLVISDGGGCGAL